MRGLHKNNRHTQKYQKDVHKLETDTYTGKSIDTLGCNQAQLL